MLGLGYCAEIPRLLHLRNPGSKFGVRGDEGDEGCQTSSSGLPASSRRTLSNQTPSDQTPNHRHHLPQARDHQNASEPAAEDSAVEAPAKPQSCPGFLGAHLREGAAGGGTREVARAHSAE
ncbi:hypothetical protein G7Z17_g507 [Cylindrodendrum hubeiense]|uniref:Uncharacterized protein n=1 Tax=Cylindrodendrum hubeiense TaxID=595255 RepID=A0A9P5HK24_9HYPO|nr:hypothetical protein G7Z17_g507 [Cylindrodendrum hubeiense]